MLKVIHDLNKAVAKKLTKTKIKFDFLYCYLKAKTIKLDSSIDKLNDFVFQECEDILCPLQIRSEISQLLEILKNLKPKTILEVGRSRGGTLFMFSRIARDDAVIISIDLNRNEGKRRPALYKSFALLEQKLHTLTMDSHKLESKKHLENILKDLKLDFLFIDGDHEYNGVKRDFELYSVLVRKGGIIAFHDIVPGSPEKTGGVPDFWNEIKTHYKYKEIVEDWNQKECGIGLIYC
ncbi:MAG: class I SAM-dependent methyltransferase [Candidatus Omnitrophica bacterium]|nr:class I SAM-dependent methyltransferase [Candidatus Omnitrophota bacterium]